ncbi:MAG: InlB B-repeat-containing protein, partial [Bacilli bacterium]
MRKIFMIILLLGAVFLTGCDLLSQSQEEKIYISFDSYGVGPISKIDLEEFTELPIPTQDGYEFLGWFYERDYQTEATNENIILLTHSISVYAQWERIQSGFDVRFVDYDGTVLKEEIVSDHGSANPPTDPVRLGHTFTGWDQNYFTITEAVTIQAQY